MGKNTFKYTVRNRDNIKFIRIFRIEDISDRLRPWLEANYCSVNDIVSVHQYTGENDAHEKPIFENDCVQRINDDQDSDPFCGIVKFLEGAFWVINDDFAFSVFNETWQWEILDEDKD